MPKDISTTNDLLYAGVAVLNEMVGMRKTVSSNRKEPWWKRRLEKEVRELNIDLGSVKTLMQNGKIKCKYKDDFGRRYRVRQKGLKTIKEEFKQRISAKVCKIKRSSSRINQYQQNIISTTTKRGFSINVMENENNIRMKYRMHNKQKSFGRRSGAKRLIITKMLNG